MAVLPICNRVVASSSLVSGFLLFIARNDSALDIKAGKAPYARLCVRYCTCSTSLTASPAWSRHMVRADVITDVAISARGFAVRNH